LRARNVKPVTLILQGPAQKWLGQSADHYLMLQKTSFFSRTLPFNKQQSSTAKPQKIKTLPNLTYLKQV
jgi:hypothetical protein